MCNCCKEYKEYPLLCGKFPMILACRYCKEHFIWNKENGKVIVNDLLFCSEKCEENYNEKNKEEN